MRVNNLDGLRVIAAILVVVGHGFVLGGGGLVPRVLGVPIHNVGLFIFFSLSGYLIACSWQRDPRLLPFLRRRALRIFPALVVVTVLTVAIIGPAASRLAASAYFSSPQSALYLANVTLVPQYELPGVFESNPHSNAVNGVFWTLGIEFCCYLATAALGLVLRRRARIGFGVAAAVAAALTLLPGLATGVRPTAEVCLFFALGALYFHVGAGVSRQLPLAPLAIAAVVGIGATALLPSSSHVVAWLLIPYAVVAIGLRAWPVLRSASRWGDFSYGIYLWGFLVQQTVLLAWPELPLAASVSTTLVLTTGLAMGSWHLVEKRALAAKTPGPSRANLGGPAAV